MLSNKKFLARLLLSFIVFLAIIGAHMAANAMDITLAWDLNDPSENVTAYRIYWDTTEFTDESKPFGDNCPIEVYLSELESSEDYPEYGTDENTAIYNFVLDDLNEGEVYYLAIQAVSDEGTSEISNLVSTGEDTWQYDDGGGSSGGGCFIRLLR